MAKIEPGQIINLALLIVGLAAIKELKGSFTASTDRLKCSKDPGKPSLTANGYEAVAGRIYGYLYDDPWEYESAIIREMNRMANDRDVCELIQAYGERGPFYGRKLTLGQALANYLSDKQLAELNGNLSAKGIKYRF